MIWRIALLAGLLIAGGARAESYRAPRNAAGRPDLEGLWSASSLTALQRTKDFTTLTATPQAAAAFVTKKHKEYAEGLAPTSPDAPPPKAGKVEDESSQWSVFPPGLAQVRGQFRTSWIVDPPDGRLPFTAQARAASEKALKAEEVYDDPEGRPFDERCLLGGGGGIAAPIMTQMLVRIVQTRDHVVLVGESNHDARIVRLGDRRHAPAAVRPWMGDAVGWWEGDTLVVETTNLAPTDRWRWNEGDWIPLSQATRTVERFTRTGPKELLYSYTVDDPGSYTQSWRGEMPFHAATGPMLEYACHEGNYSLTHILAGARAQERDGAKAVAAASGP